MRKSPGTIFKNNQGVFQDLDYLIITPAFLKPQADKLAAFHSSYSRLNVKTVTLESIYEEFSSGKQDIAAIRNFVKYVYFNASNPSKKIKYINLLSIPLTITYKRFPLKNFIHFFFINNKSNMFFLYFIKLNV